MSNHTPGPWFAEGCTIYNADSTDFSNRTPENVVAYTADDFIEKPGREKRANATLISSAPDLLAALEEHHRIALEYNGDAYAASACRAQTEAAIAKAKGESQ